MFSNKREADRKNTGSNKKQCNAITPKLALATALHEKLMQRLPVDAQGKFWLNCAGHRAQFTAPTVQDLMKLSTADLQHDLDAMDKEQ